jgi:hypothetical protein
MLCTCIQSVVGDSYYNFLMKALPALLTDSNFVISSITFWLDDQGSGFQWPATAGNFFFTTASRTALGPTQPPIQWVPGAPSLGVQWPGREADNSPPASAEVKNGWSYTSTPPIRLHGVVLSQALECVFSQGPATDPSIQFRGPVWHLVKSCFFTVRSC